MPFEKGGKGPSPVGFCSPMEHGFHCARELLKPRDRMRQENVLVCLLDFGSANSHSSHVLSGVRDSREYEYEYVCRVHRLPPGRLRQVLLLVILLTSRSPSYYPSSLDRISRLDLGVVQGHWRRKRTGQDSFPLPTRLGCLQGPGGTLFFPSCAPPAGPLSMRHLILPVFAGHGSIYLLGNLSLHPQGNLWISRSITTL